MLESWTVNYQEYDEEIQYTIRWSPWGAMDRWVINRIVPAEAGMLQLWVKRGRGVELLHTQSTYYSGLRSILREAIDTMAPAGMRLRELIGGREAWFRYSTMASRDHLTILEKWFGDPEGLFDKFGRAVSIREEEIMRKFPLPPPDIRRNEKKILATAGFGPSLPKKELQ